MASLSDLQTRLDRLRKMRASGVLSLSHGDTRTEFRTMDELTRAIGYVQDEIAAAGGAVQTRTFKVTSGKDL